MFSLGFSFRHFLKIRFFISGRRNPIPYPFGFNRIAISLPNEKGRLPANFVVRLSLSIGAISGSRHYGVDVDGG